MYDSIMVDCIGSYYIISYHVILYQLCYVKCSAGAQGRDHALAALRANLGPLPLSDRSWLASMFLLVSKSIPLEVIPIKVFMEE